MVEGHGRDEWARMSALLALIANAHRDPKKGRALRPSDFDPFERQADEVIQIDRRNMATLKQAFVGRKGF